MHASTSDAAAERMRFVIYEDNGGRFHWRLVGDDGASVAVSAAAFDSQADARLAAAEVYRDAGAGTSP